jgi:hypothetical protein
MQYHDNKLCLTYTEFVPDIMGKPNYDQSKARKTINVIGRGNNGSAILIEYETLPVKYKEAVIKKYGDPYKYIAKQPICEWCELNKDEKAEDFYSTHILTSTGLNLPDAYIPKYTKAATWINAINHFTTDKRALKRGLDVSIATFWDMVSELIITKDIALPTANKRLKEKIKKFNAEGPISLIETWRFGNDYSKKVKDELAESVLLDMIAHDHKHDDTIICRAYNEWAIANNREQITAATVGHWRRTKHHMVALKRDGKVETYKKYSKHILRDRPSAPLLMINSDDNILDLYFIDEKRNSKGHKADNPYYRPALYLVMDSYNDYPLGYAIGETVTIDLIKAAYLNAIHHIKSLTNNTYLWHQIVTDRWSIDPALKGELATFFGDQAKYTPAKAKIAQGKYIERAFGTEWHQILKVLPNYAGHNITAKERINPDGILARKKNFPVKEKAPDLVELFINALRCNPNPKTGISRQTEWVEAFNASEMSKKRQLSDEKRLRLFGTAHSEINRLRVSGLTPQIHNRKYVFDIPARLFPENTNKAVQVIYDPYDMEKVLVTDGKGLRFVAEKYQKDSAALADQGEGSRTRLNSRLQEKTDIFNRLTSYVTNTAMVLQRNEIDTESILQSGLLVKEISHYAQRSLTPGIKTTDIEDDDEDIDIRKLM